MKPLSQGAPLFLSLTLLLMVPIHTTSVEAKVIAKTPAKSKGTYLKKPQKKSKGQSQYRTKPSDKAQMNYIQAASRSKPKASVTKKAGDLSKTFNKSAKGIPRNSLSPGGKPIPTPAPSPGGAQGRNLPYDASSQNRLRDGQPVKDKKIDLIKDKDLIKEKFNKKSESD